MGLLCPGQCLASRGGVRGRVKAGGAATVSERALVGWGFRKLGPHTDSAPNSAAWGSKHLALLWATKTVEWVVLNFPPTLTSLLGMRSTSHQLDLLSPTHTSDQTRSLWNLNFSVCLELILHFPPSWPSFARILIPSLPGDSKGLLTSLLPPCSCPFHLSSAVKCYLNNRVDYITLLLIALYGSPLPSRRKPRLHTKFWALKE